MVIYFPILEDFSLDVGIAVRSKMLLKRHEELNRALPRAEAKTRRKKREEIGKEEREKRSPTPFLSLSLSLSLESSAVARARGGFFLGRSGIHQKGNQLLLLCGEMFV